MEATHLYRYGLIAADVCAVLSRFEAEQRPGLEPQEMEVIARAERLLDDAMRGGSLFVYGEKYLSADTNAVQAFGSGLSAIQACPSAGDMKGLGDAVSWLHRIKAVVASLGDPVRARALTSDELASAKCYFDCLAEQMISALNQPPAQSPVF